MAFRTNAAPYQRAKNSTLKIMLILLAALVVVWVFGIVYSFQLQGEINEFLKSANEAVSAFNEKNANRIELGKVEALVPYEYVNYGLKAILMVVVAVAVTAACDVLTTIIKHKKDSKESLGKEIVHDLIHNYSWISAIIFALCLPVYTSYYVVIIGSIFATVVVKNLFGGFGKNIFNPAIMARIFVGLCFASQMAIPEEITLAAEGVKVGTQFITGIGVSAGIDVATGATLSTAYNTTSGWLDSTRNTGAEVIFGSIFSGFGLRKMFLGQYLGALGETFTLVIFILGIILSGLKVINWRTPVFYLGTVTLTTLVIALALGLNQPIRYVLNHIALGGLMFGAVFMLTDPVTGPTSPFGKSLIGVIAGLLTVLIRIKGGYPEGVMFSIAICNLISPAIDSLTVGKSSSHFVRKCCVAFGTVLLSIGLCTGVAWSVNEGQEVYAINDINIVQYTKLEESLKLKDGHEYKEASDYNVVNKANIKGFVMDEQTGKGLKPVYYIIDGNDNVVAYAYIVEYKYEIDTGHGKSPVTGHAIVAINTDGSYYGFGALDNLCTSGATGPYADIADINKYGNFIGNKDLSTLPNKDKDVNYISGATESSKLIVEIVKLAYAEYNAYDGGDSNE